jgi:hypothetical protein
MAVAFLIAGYCLALLTFNPCDVNRDGKVNALDLLIVKRTIVGK